jgi:uncharacterized protein YcaQ
MPYGRMARTLGLGDVQFVRRPLRRLKRMNLLELIERYGCLMLDSIGHWTRWEE